MRLCIRSQDTGAKTPLELAEFLSAADLGVQLVPHKTFAGVSFNGSALSEGFAGEIGQALRDKTCEVCLIGAYFNPVHPSRDKAENGIAAFKHYISRASLLGGGMVGSETGSLNGDKWTYHKDNRTEESLSAVVRVFKELSSYAKTFGVNVGIEGAAGHVCYSVSALKRAIEEINADNLYVIFDLFNLLEASTAPRYLDILEQGLDTFKDKIKVFHLKDYVLSGGEIKQCAIGRGEFDYRAILSRIKKNHKDAYCVLEGTTGEDIAPSALLLKKIWNEV